MTLWQFAWRRGWRAVGWFLPILAAGIIFGAILTSLGGLRIAFLRFNALEVVLPLFVGVQAALLFAPDDEPPLELILAKPRPLVYVLFERVAALALIYSVIALTASLVVTSLPNAESLVQTLIRWLPPSLCMIGIGAWISVSTRKASNGAFAAVMLCGAMAVGQSVLLPKYDFMAWVMFYVQPWDVTPERYLANRLIVSLIGLVTFLLTVNLMRDSERMLGTNQAVAL
ncbi:MAG: hypothetical protein IPK17_25725 [Chloroflexi bacterium]|uniref:hypothetical protein n=1 Tax=Candidatus Flexifilum breve TaxID=3140694 RepID=UPI00313555AA|nr:hypothetical protein [Chloroflexota bacterium]